MDLFILKTDGEKFTSTNKKTLHLIIKTLGVFLDDQQISSVRKSSYFYLRALRHIRSMLTGVMANSIAVALVSSRLDDANSVLFGTSTANLHKIQRVQKTLAKIVLNDSITILYCFSPTSLTSC